MGDRDTETLAWIRAVPLAHRGLHRPGVPENSLLSFDAACEAGVGIELDVRLTADGVPMVCHDLDLSRITGVAGRIDRLARHAIEAMRLVDSDESLPSLEDALATIAGRVPVMVEVKNEGTRVGPVEEAVAKLLVSYQGPHVVASFNPWTVRWFERSAPDVPRVLTGGSSDVVPALARGVLRSMLRRHVGRPLALSWNVKRLDDPIVVAAREAGMPVITWTVRTTDDLALARAGADQMIFEGLDVDLVRSAAAG